MRLGETLSRNPLSSIASLVLIMLSIFTAIYLLGNHYLSREYIVVEGGNYPVPTNVSGSVLISMGNGEYEVKVKPLNINNPNYTVSCIQQSIVKTTCTNLNSEACNITCREGVIVHYNGVIPPHRIKITSITVEKK